MSAEVISADAFQVYKGMDIGTGKDLEEYSINGNLIPFHLIDIINPSDDYSVYSFQKQFHLIYSDILQRDKCPILCGGTGLYIESVLLNYEISSIKPDYNLRSKLEKLSKDELLLIFEKKDSKAYKDWKCDTKQRIIRGIEIASKGESRNKLNKYNLKIENSVVLGIKMDRDIIRSRITQRLEDRLKNGMIEEVELLLSKGIIKMKRLEYFGLEYKYVGFYLSGKISYEEMFTKLNTAIHKFAKKQMTFFRRMEKRGININWIEGSLEQAMNRINSK